MATPPLPAIGGSQSRKSTSGGGPLSERHGSLTVLPPAGPSGTGAPSPSGGAGSSSFGHSSK